MSEYNKGINEASKVLSQRVNNARFKMNEARELGNNDLATTWMLIVSHLDAANSAVQQLLKEE